MILPILVSNRTLWVPVVVISAVADGYWIEAVAEIVVVATIVWVLASDSIFTTGADWVHPPTSTRNAMSAPARILNLVTDIVM
jgi:hypothetical protein